MALSTLGRAGVTTFTAECFFFCCVVLLATLLLLACCGFLGAMPVPAATAGAVLEVGFGCGGGTDAFPIDDEIVEAMVEIQHKVHPERDGKQNML
jgi:hypothetical protein